MNEFSRVHSFLEHHVKMHKSDFFSAPHLSVVGDSAAARVGQPSCGSLAPVTPGVAVLFSSTLTGSSQETRARVPR